MNGFGEWSALVLCLPWPFKGGTMTEYTARVVRHHEGNRYVTKFVWSNGDELQEVIRMAVALEEATGDRYDIEFD